MAYTTINKSSEHFNTKLYTGNGTTDHAQTGVGFQPDWTWIKDRSATESHFVFDAVRGHSKYIFPNGNNAEGTDATGILKSFDSDGFTLGTNDGVNKNSDNYASWNWKANGQGSANTDGTINTTYTSVNTTAGFSISTYTGNATAGATIGHGLGTTPSMIIVKNRSATGSWRVYHKSLGANYLIQLNLNGAALDNTTWNDTAPTSSVFTINSTSDVNASGNEFVAYCFAEKTGYSKFGSYTGNGSLDGSFIYTGFKPAFVIIKGTNTNDWVMFDNKRNGTYSLSGNPRARFVFANLNNAEDGADNYNHVDFLSNGIKIKEDNGTINTSGQSYIYMAFGQSLVGSNNVPCTAR